MKLRISRGEAFLSDLEVEDGEYVIGSGAAAGIRVASDSIAPEHVRLRVGGRRAAVEDLGSGFGTWIGESALKGAQMLTEGAVLRVGDVAFEILGDGALAVPGQAESTVGRYSVGEIVARGNMGVIRSAHELHTGREVAMKQMLPARDALRFIREAKIAAHLEHPNIVPVYDVSEGGHGEHYYTMKMVRGVTMEELLGKIAEGDAETVKAYPLERLLTIFQKVCDAMAFAHAKGIIHRDLKPENIMVGEFGEVLVMDWGLARTDSDGAFAGAARNTADYENAGGDRTQDGTIMGTPHYMSPEQATGDQDAIDARSDVYSLGGILYKLLTLETPVDGAGAREVLRRVRDGKIVAPLQRVGSVRLPHLPGGRVPNSLSAVTMKALNLAPDRRYASVKDLQADVDAYQNGRATSAERASVGRQIALLIRRNKAVFAIGTTATVTLIALATVFLIRLSSERSALEAAGLRASQNATVASEKEKAAEAAEKKAEAAILAATASKDAADKALLAAEAAKKEAAEQTEVAAEQTRLKQMATESAKLAETSAAMKTAEAEAARKAAMAAEKERTKAVEDAKSARQTKVTERLAKLVPDAEAAARNGDFGNVLINSVAILSDPATKHPPEMLSVHQRRIRAALGQMPRLLFLQEGAVLARIAPNGSRFAMFESGEKRSVLSFWNTDGLTEEKPAIAFPSNMAVEDAAFSASSKNLFAVLRASSGHSTVRLWDLEHREVRYPVMSSFTGVLERIMPLPDQSKAVTVHALRGAEHARAVSVWDLESAIAFRQETNVVKGIPWALSSDWRPKNFNLQTFKPSTAALSAAFRLAPNSTGMQIEPANDSPLKSATAVSPDGDRVVQLYQGELTIAELIREGVRPEEPGPLALHISDGPDARAQPLRSEIARRQKLVNVRTNAVIYDELRGGESAFSPDSKWLIMSAGRKAILHDAAAPQRRIELSLIGPPSALGFCGDSSRAIISIGGFRANVATEGEDAVDDFRGATVSMWGVNGRKACPEVFFKSEPRHISASRDGRYLLANGETTSLWDTAPARPLRPLDLDELRDPGNCAIWVSADGTRAVGIQRPDPIVLQQMLPGTAPKVNLRAYDLRLSPPKSIGAQIMEFPTDSCCWLTKSGRFLLIWGRGFGAKVWDIEKNGERTIFDGNPKNNPTQYNEFYDGRGVVVLESETDTTMGLVAEGANGRGKSALIFDVDAKQAEKWLPDGGSLKGRFSPDGGVQRVPDIDGRVTIDRVARRLKREPGSERALPPDARRAVYSEDQKLVAVLCTSAADRSVESEVLSAFVFDSDLLGRTKEEREKREVRDYRLRPLMARDWRMHVYDVATGECILGDVTLPALAAFRWEDQRCVAMSSEGNWWEIDLSPDTRNISDLQEIANLITGRAVDRTTGTIAPVKLSAVALHTAWSRIREKYSKLGVNWQTGISTARASQ